MLHVVELTVPIKFEKYERVSSINSSLIVLKPWLRFRRSLKRNIKIKKKTHYTSKNSQITRSYEQVRKLGERIFDYIVQAREKCFGKVWSCRASVHCTEWTVRFRRPYVPMRTRYLRTRVSKLTWKSKKKN